MSNLFGSNSGFLNFIRHHWLLVLGAVILFAPTYYNLVTNVWTSEDQAHGPLIVAVVAYLVWSLKDKLKEVTAERSSNFLGFGLLIFGLLVYIVGRSQDVVLFDVGSQILVLSGLVLLSRGAKTLKVLWFPLFFIVFMIPLPGFLLDAITLPMKIAVSWVAENILYTIGYPISRSGVVLQIGQYQLLVADACAGLHTLISLEALGLLYLNLVKHDSLARNLFLALLIVPISFTANVIRVMVLTLITYHFGDAAGQGFVHGFAGMLLFVVALILIISVDSIIQFLVRTWNKNFNQ